MAEAAVKITGIEGNQDLLDAVTENLMRIKLAAKMLWEIDELDDVERGSLSIMLNREVDEIFNTLAEA